MESKAYASDSMQAHAHGNRSVMPNPCRPNRRRGASDGTHQRARDVSGQLPTRVVGKLRDSVLESSTMRACRHALSKLFTSETGNTAGPVRPTRGETGDPQWGNLRDPSSHHLASRQIPTSPAEGEARGASASLQDPCRTQSAALCSGVDDRSRVHGTQVVVNTADGAKVPEGPA